MDLTNNNNLNNEVRIKARDIDINCDFCVDCCKDRDCCLFNAFDKKNKIVDTEYGIMCEKCNIDFLKTEKMLNEILLKRRNELYY